MNKLVISQSRRFLVFEGTVEKPFFYLGDTAWELFHRLTREEASFYLKNRAAKGFTVIQAVALAEFDGLQEPNRNRDLPLHDLDPTKPNEAYFAHMDSVIREAGELGMYVGLLPSWGDKVNKKWGVGPVVFNPENAFAYGKWLGERYKGYENIIWINGGDRAADEPVHLEVWRKMAAGIKAGGATQVMTFHPQGSRTSSEYFQGEDWLNFNMWQSGHGKRDERNWAQIASDYAKTPVKPVLDGEPCYEDHPVAFKANAERGWFDEYDCRKAAWRAVLAGACGHTYGCHDIWQFLDTERHPPITIARTHWKKAIDLPGATQMKIMKDTMLLRDWLKLVPDQSLLVEVGGEAEGHCQAARASDGSYVYVYTPLGKPLVVKTAALWPGLAVSWLDPRSGKTLATGEKINGSEQTFTPPSSGVGNDWVLVIG